MTDDSVKCEWCGDFHDLRDGCFSGYRPEEEE